MLLLLDEGESESSQNRRLFEGGKEKNEMTMHLVHVRDSLPSPRTPRQHYNTLLSLVDNIDDLIGKLLPAFLAVRTGLVGLDGEGGVEEEDTSTSEGDEVTADEKRWSQFGGKGMKRTRREGTNPCVGTTNEGYSSFSSL
jgi:hypothetical protein